MIDAPYRMVGTPRFGGILIIADHASNRVPDGIELGIDPALLEQHIAWDIGVMGIATRMAQRPGVAAFLGNVSRLVCDFNREEHAPAIIPIASDGHAIPGNSLSHEGARGAAGALLPPLSRRARRTARRQAPRADPVAAQLHAEPYQFGRAAPLASRRALQ